MYAEKHNKGFGMIELFGGLAITSVLVIGSYKFFGSLGTTARGTVAETQATYKLEKVFDKMNNELRNVAFIDEGDASILANEQSSTCGGNEFANALIPLPGYTAAAIDTKGNLNAIDPSDPDLIDDPAENNDGLRFIHYAEDSATYELAIDTGTTKPYLTTGLNDIVANGTGLGISIGDYFVISDTESSDLFRITSMLEVGANTILGKAPTISIWNLSFTRNYGVDGDNNVLNGGVQLQKVKLSTYAVNTSNGLLMKDLHTKDDGFDPSVKTFDNNPRLLKNWITIASDVTQFQVKYQVADDDNINDSTVFVRTPRASEHGEINSSGSLDYCGNQLGLPYIRQIRIELTTTEQPLLAKMSNPVGLKRGSSGEGSGAGLASAFLVIEATLPPPGFDDAEDGGDGTPSCTSGCNGGGSY